MTSPIGLLAKVRKSGYVSRIAFLAPAALLSAFLLTACGSSAPPSGASGASPAAPAAPSGASYSTSPSAEAVTASALNASVGEVFTSKLGVKTTAQCEPSEVEDDVPLIDWQCDLSVPPNSGPTFAGGGGPQGSIDIEITGSQTWQQVD